MVVHIFGAPGALVIDVNRRVGLQHWVDDAPGFFDVVLARKEGWVASHGVAEEQFVRLHFVRVGMMVGEQFGLLTDESFAGSHDGDAEREVYIGADAEAQVVLLKLGRADCCGGQAETRNHFGAFDREIFAGAKVERDAAPAPGIDFESQYGECFRSLSFSQRRVRRDSL